MAEETYRCGALPYEEWERLMILGPLSRLAGGRRMFSSKVRDERADGERGYLAIRLGMSYCNEREAEVVVI